MVALLRVEGLTALVPALGGSLAGVSAIAGFALTPVSVIESLMWKSGVATLIPAAGSLPGIIARAGLATATGIVVGAIIWSILYLTVGPGGFSELVDSHPDAPPRRPLFATTDLGTPLMDVRAAPPERPLPRDLDLPLAAFDPEAVPERPMTPVRPLAPLAPRPQLIDPGDRIETFALTPLVRAAPQEAKPSIETLLRRLEQSARRREPADNPPPRLSLDETIGSLRRLA